MESARVLVAEDDRSVRDALVLALELEGYTVSAQPDGERALHAYDEFAPDVLILDVMMPTIDGLTVCRRLRARKVTTPILVLTARDQVSDRVTGLDAGADDYVVKPFSLDELLARLPRSCAGTPPMSTSPNSSSATCGSTLGGGWSPATVVRST